MAQPPFSNLRVLLAEDNQVNAEITRTFLSSLGCTVVGVEDGKRALDALDAGRFDIVLMDCQMPVMSGLEATTAIRDKEARGEAWGDAARLPIIALTAAAGEEDRVKFLGCGMDDVLTKPFDRDQLSDMLTRWLPETGGEISGGAAAAGAMDADTVLDQAALEMIRSLAMTPDSDVLARLIRLFLDDAAAQLEIVASGDGRAVAQAAHSIKSSAANMGAMKLAALALALEQAAADGAGEDSRRLGGDVAAAFAEVKPLLEAELRTA